MKNIVLLMVITLLSSCLFGCQNGHVTVETKSSKRVPASNEIDQLIAENEILKVEVSKTKGVDPTVYGESDELATFENLILNATSEAGIANVTNPEYYLKFTNAAGETQRFHLWIGNENETSILIDASDTHKIYTLSSNITVELFELLEKNR